MTHKHLHLKLSLDILFLIFLLTACGSSQTTIPTPLPTITPISGWHKITNEGFEIWLPDNFIGSTKVNIDVLAEQMAELGPEFEQQANALKDEKASFIIFAFDKNKSNPGLMTNLSVGKEIVPSNISVEKYAETIGSRLAKPYEIIETKTLASDRYSIGVLITRADFPQIGDVSQIMYAVRSGGAVWQVVFTTPSNEFEERLPVFEEIVRSVTVPFTTESPSRQGNPIIFGIGVALIIFALLLKSWQKQKKDRSGLTTISL